MKKILHITPSYRPATAYGGPTISIGELCESIGLLEKDITVFTTTANGKFDLPEYASKYTILNRVKIFYFQRWTKDHSHFSPRLLMKLLFNIKQYDVIHIHSWWNTVAIFSVIICLLRGVSPIISLRGMLSAYTFENGKWSNKKIFHKLLGKYLLSKCILHVTSEKERRECKTMIGKFNGFILPNIIDYEENIKSVRKRSDSTFSFVLLSRIHPVKNIDFFFYCLPNLEFPYSVNIIGEGETKYVENLKILSKQLKIEDKINWLGGVYDISEKFAHLHNSDLFIQLSHTENFGNSVIEAALVGTPVLVSDQVGASDYVKNLNLGLKKR